MFVLQEKALISVHFVFYSKQGNKIEGVVLNRVCILGFFCPRQGQGFKSLVAHLYPNIGRVPRRAPGWEAGIPHMYNSDGAAKFLSSHLGVGIAD